MSAIADAGVFAIAVVYCRKGPGGPNIRRRICNVDECCVVILYAKTLPMIEEIS